MTLAENQATVTGSIRLVTEAGFRHRRQLELTEAIRGAVVKTLSDSWVYSRSRSRSDESPLLAAAVTLWKAEVEIQVLDGATMAGWHIL